MRTLAIVALLGMVGSAHAGPLTLLCTGSLTLDGKQSDINRETAILDLESRTFKPPLYPAFPVMKIAENEITFGSELPTLSSWGSLDRVSGSLSLNVMTPQERKNLQAGATVRFLAWMQAKCIPAQRMF